MVTLHFLSVIREVTYRTSTLLFALVLVFVILSLAVSLLMRLIERIKSLSKRKLRDVLLDYMVADAELNELDFRRSQMPLVIELFSSIISSIKGRLQHRMKLAVRSLGLIHAIERDVHSAFPAKRLRSCHRLGMLESRISTPVLAGALEDGNPKVRSAAVIALGAIHDEKTIPSLLRFFRSCTYAHAWLIADILPFFGTGTYQHVKPYLKLGTLPRQKLILLLKVIAQVRVVESLDDLYLLYTRSEDMDIRINALVAIGKMNDIRAVKTVLDALSHSEWQIRAIASRIIGEMSLKGAAYRLIPLIKDENWHVRRNAAEALTSLGKIGITLLLACLDMDNRYARDISVQILEERGIVEQAVYELGGDDPKKRNDALILIKTLIRKGYTGYLENYQARSTLIQELMAELSHG